MIRIKLIKMGNRGWAEYDPETETYDWDYEGDDTPILNALRVLEDGKEFTELTAVDEVNWGEKDDKTRVGNAETHQFRDWDGQMEDLQSMLEYRGAQTLLYYE